MNSYQLFCEIIGKIEEMQDTLNHLREIVKAAIKQSTPSQTPPTSTKESKDAAD